MQNSTTAFESSNFNFRKLDEGELLGYVKLQGNPELYEMEPWKPDDSNIRFLNSRIMEQSKFETADFGESKLYRATFFSRISYFETVVEARLWSDRQELKQGLQHKFRGFGQISMPVIGIFERERHGCGEKSSATENAVERISRMIRGSNALKVEDGHSISGSLFFADKGGLGLYDPIVANRAQFERYLICVMLVIAYESVLSRISTDLSKLVSTPLSSENSGQILHHYQNFLRFTSSSFAEFPIVRSSGAVYEVWEIYKQHYNITGIYSEVERQLSTISKFLQAEESRKLLATQNQLLNSERERARLEADERRKADHERNKADQARWREEVFQQRVSKRQARLGMIVTLIGLLIALISIPDPIRLKLCEKIPATEGLVKSTIELVCAE